MLGPNPVVGINRRGVFETLYGLMSQALKEPSLFFQHTFHLWSELFEVLKGTSKIEPDKKDARFDDLTWKYNPFYNRLMKSYLAIRKELNDWLEKSNMSEYDKKRAHFVMALFTEALAPSNTALNPVALKRVFETSGLSVVNGMKNFFEDLVNNGGMPAQVDKKAFELGKNLALTPGSVVYRTEMIELIQYKPTTEKVRARPLLVVPPQINKYYTFDLSPNKSVAKFLVEHLGIQTFVISWRNPTAKHRNWGFQDYIATVEDAIRVVNEITGSEDVNLTGACSGGMTVATLLGNLAVRNEKKVNSTTLLVSVLDTHAQSDNGTPLGLFATDDAIEAARQHSSKHGILKGEDMAKVFSWMRPNDLVWNYWVNNYLIGNPPPTFDVLYWNADTTQLPAKFHSELLDLFKENPLLRNKEEVNVVGMPVNLSKVKSDMYFVAGITDHITPWEACYKSIHLFGGKKEFVLSNSGHIQSILNPPGNPKASFMTNDSTQPADPKEWYKGSKLNEGSWWLHWAKWLVARSGEEKTAPAQVGNETYKPIVPAPGTYVFE
ncbi:MAG: alpha/beta fold hydrolase [Cytophagales bacterium]|nr:MAG: alpha/beta fold hydrolase [Cytophagales bacterium]